jgi:hypothetical protein
MERYQFAPCASTLRAAVCVVAVTENAARFQQICNFLQTTA